MRLLSKVGHHFVQQQRELIISWKLNALISQEEQKTFEIKQTKFIETTNVQEVYLQFFFIFINEFFGLKKLFACTKSVVKNCNKKF